MQDLQETVQEVQEGPLRPYQGYQESNEEG